MAVENGWTLVPVNLPDVPKVQVEAVEGDGCCTEAGSMERGEGSGERLLLVLPDAMPCGLYVNDLEWCR